MVFGSGPALGSEIGLLCYHGVWFKGQGASAKVGHRVIMLCRSEVQGLWLELSCPMLIYLWGSGL